jgi:phage shock protein A
MLNEYSREMEQLIAKAESALSRQIFVENKQAALILDIKSLMEKRTRQAKLALEQGDEQIAKLAVVINAPQKILFFNLVFIFFLLLSFSMNLV